MIAFFDGMRWRTAILLFALGVLDILGFIPSFALVKKWRTKQMNQTHQPVIRNPGEGRVIGVVGDVYRFLATGEDTQGHYALVAPG